MKELIIKIDEEKMDIEGNAPIVDRPQELVRCKDCKFMIEDDVFQCGIKAGYFPVNDDWFCADGELR